MEIERQLTECRKFSSNLSMDVEKIIAIACNLGTLWEKGSFSDKQQIQNLAFPEGVKWDREKDIPRTDFENGVLAAFRTISSSYKTAKAQKKRNLDDFSHLVAGAGLEYVSFPLLTV